MLPEIAVNVCIFYLKEYFSFRFISFHFKVALQARRHSEVEKYNVRTDIRVTSSNPRVMSLNSRVMSSNPRVKRLKARFARLKARVGRLK